MRFSSTIVASILILFCFNSNAEVCQRPSQPDVSDDRYQALQKRAAFAAFLADECGFENDVQKRFSVLIKIAFSNSEEDQQRNLDNFKSRKKQYFQDSSFLGRKKSCFIETGKTRALVSEASEDLAGYTEMLSSARRKYLEKMDEWNRCKERAEDQQYCCCETAKYRSGMKQDWGEYAYDGAEFNWTYRDSCKGTERSGGLFIQTKTSRSCTSKDRCGR